MLILIWFQTYLDKHMLWLYEWYLGDTDCGKTLLCKTSHNQSVTCTLFALRRLCSLLCQHCWQREVSRCGEQSTRGQQTAGLWPPLSSATLPNIITHSALFKRWIHRALRILSLCVVLVHQSSFSLFQHIQQTERRSPETHRSLFMLSLSLMRPFTCFLLLLWMKPPHPDQTYQQNQQTMQGPGLWLALQPAPGQELAVRSKIYGDPVMQGHFSSPLPCPTAQRSSPLQTITSMSAASPLGRRTAEECWAHLFALTTAAVYGAALEGGRGNTSKGFTGWRGASKAKIH